MRAGLTGLGVVFLFTAAASLLFAPMPGDIPPASQLKEPGEPLSQLGVAPSSENEQPRPANPPPPVVQHRMSDGRAAESPSESPVAESPVTGSPAQGFAGAGGGTPVEI